MLLHYKHDNCSMPRSYFIICAVCVPQVFNKRVIYPMKWTIIQYPRWPVDSVNKAWQHQMITCRPWICTHEVDISWETLLCHHWPTLQWCHICLMASQITGILTVQEQNSAENIQTLLALCEGKPTGDPKRVNNLTVCSRVTFNRNIKVLLTLCGGGIHSDWWIPLTKGRAMWKVFLCHGIIM